MSHMESPLRLSNLREYSTHNVDSCEESAPVSLHEQSRDSYTTHSTYDEDLLDDIADMMDEECVLEEATIMDTNEAKKRASIVDPPTLPPKSNLRASRLLDSLKLTSIESATQSLNITHEMYLSSEEDASSSADDFSDYEYESTSEVSQKSPVGRLSHEDTAKVVSVVFSGKPSIVNLPRRSISPNSESGRPQTSPHEGSSKVFNLPIFKERPSFPARQSSLFSLRTLPSARPSFLSIDPYANGSNYTLASTKENQIDCPSPQTPKTPTFKGAVQKTISLVRKRSMHTLTNFNGNSGAPRDSLSLTASSSTLDILQTAPEEPSTLSEQNATETVPSPQSPLKFHDIVRAATSAAKKNAALAQTQQPPRSPISPVTPKRGLLDRMSRRRSMKT